MRCEEPGVLRAYLDGELDTVACTRMAGHLTVCEDCRRQLEQMRADANLTNTAFHLLPSEDDISSAGEASAWSALQARLARPSSAPAPYGNPLSSHSQSPALAPHKVASKPDTAQFGGIWRMVTSMISPRQRMVFAGALMSLLIVGLLILPGGRAAAIDFLNLFRVQRFAVVTVDPNQPFDALRHLEHLGAVNIPAHRAPSNDVNLTPEAAGVRTMMQVKVPATLPAGMATKPQVSIFPGSEASFTVERAKAEAYLKSINAPKPAVPTSLDGAKLVVKVPAAVTLMYGDASGQPGLVVAQLKSPTATVEGNASLAEMRDFLLGIPGMPADTVAQLKAIDDWTNTLPVPVPRNRALWKEIPFNGTQALMIADPSAGFSGLMWQKDGVVYAVMSKLSEAQLMSIAQSMK